MVLRVFEQGWSLAEAADGRRRERAGLLEWIARYRAEGEAGLLDRSSAPNSIPTARPTTCEVVVVLRKLRMTGAEIAFCLRMALRRALRCCCVLGLESSAGWSRPSQPNRYERRHAGELLHVDVEEARTDSRWPRGTSRPRPPIAAAQPAQRDAAGRDRKLVGWEYVHVCIDDATRLAYVEVLEDEKATTAVDFLQRAVAFYASHGITVQAVMSDNGACYRSTIHAFACRDWASAICAHGPTGHSTNGKAERFIRTLIAGWAYGAIYGSSHERTRALDGWLWTYNHRRPHGALSHKPPVSSPQRAEQPA